MIDKTKNRRPLKTRQREWPHRVARFFVSLDVTPNQMSVAGLVAAAGGGAAYWLTIGAPPLLRSGLLVAAAVFIQLRLLANMLDGLMAIEEGKKSATGPLYNEVPDRAADAIFLVMAGYAAGCPVLGWLCAVLAFATAYVRALGGSFGLPQDFCGPMAKPHRMFVLTVGSLVAAVFLPHLIVAVALLIIAVGCVATLGRRLYRIAHGLSRHVS